MKTDCVRMENVRVKLGFNGKSVIDTIDKGGGMCLLWSNDVDVSLLSYSQFHIDVYMVSHRGISWRLTDFYSHPQTAQRHHGWTLYRRLNGLSSLPWVCAGDFNEMLDDSEKLGCLRRSHYQIENFRVVLDDCRFT